MRPSVKTLFIGNASVSCGLFLPFYSRVRQLRSSCTILFVPSVPPLLSYYLLVPYYPYSFSRSVPPLCSYFCAVRSLLSVLLFARSVSFSPFLFLRGPFPPLCSSFCAVRSFSPFFFLRSPFPPPVLIFARSVHCSTYPSAQTLPLCSNRRLYQQSLRYKHTLLGQARLLSQTSQTRLLRPTRLLSQAPSAPFGPSAQSGPPAPFGPPARCA